MTVTPTAIDLTQWTAGDLRDDIRRCMTALSLLNQDSPARPGLAHVIRSSVAELLRRSPQGTDEPRAAMCQCGEVFIAPDAAAKHFTTVFVPAGNVGKDGRIHQEIAVPGAGNPVL